MYNKEISNPKKKLNSTKIFRLQSSVSNYAALTGEKASFKTFSFFYRIRLLHVLHKLVVF